MKYHQLELSKQRKSHRVGRGIAAGRGKTAGRGTKGQGARKSPTKAGFEGGQMPIHMRLPKLAGFKSRRPVVENVQTGQLGHIKGTLVDNHTLAEVGLVSSAHVKVKLIVGGELKTKKSVKLQGASASAVILVESAGGSFEKVAQIPRQVKKSSKA